MYMSESRTEGDHMVIVQVVVVTKSKRKKKLFQIHKVVYHHNAPFHTAVKTEKFLKKIIYNIGK